MPRLEKLSEQYKNRTDVLFLSMNMDDDPGMIGPFKTQNKLTFAVLPAYDYVTETLKVNGIPQNWIVGPDGVIRLKGVGYDPTDKWEEGMKSAIEKVRAAAPSAPPAASAAANASGSNP